jgi:tetratricopeptide (TPR) repeat protein
MIELNMIRKMKRTILLLLMIILYVGNCFAQSPDDLMKQGNKLYQEGQYENAVETYYKIISQGFESSALYYNLGNAYFKAGQLGYSIYNYEKGLKLSPGDEDLAYNLKIANARTVDKITELPKLFIVQWWEVLVTSLSVMGWSLVVVVLFWIFFSSIGLYLLNKKFQIQKFAFVIGSISLAVLIVSIIILISRYSHEASSNYGILVEPIYNVKLGPDEKSNDAFVVHEGIKFIVEDRVNDWYKIRLADGKVGWIQGSFFKQI